MVKRIRIIGNVPVCFLKERDSFIAFSPALDLSSFGKSLKEAKSNFSEALDIFFEECTKMGTLKDVLESFGWTRQAKKGFIPPTYIGEDSVKIPDLAVA